MGEYTLLDHIRDFIGGIAFTVFLWSARMTEEQYWDAIYEQEQYLREQNSSEL